MLTSGIGNTIRTVGELSPQSSNTDLPGQDGYSSGATSTTENKGGSALHAAVSRGAKDEVMKLLVFCDAEVNARDDQGRIPLHLTADRAIVKALLDHGTDVLATDHQGACPLHSAVARGAWVDVLRMLLARGANVNARNHSGQTALHLATLSHYQVVKLLLDNGAEVNAADDEGRTPLHWAVGGASRSCQEHCFCGGHKEKFQVVVM